MTTDTRHIPAAGKASGLAGESLCGRYARYNTGDHDRIRRLARKADEGAPAEGRMAVLAEEYGYCLDCILRLRIADGRVPAR
jgi:hypothetical protein